MSDLQSLLERVEAATTDDDRGLDDEISRVDPEHRHKRIHPYIDGTLIDDANVGRLHTTPYYSSSLDAALALVERVLPGWQYVIRARSATLWRTDPASTQQIGGDGATPALALLAALLRALTQPKDPR